MYPDPDFAQSEIHNDRFVLMDGVVGLTFDERTGIVYFQPLATDRYGESRRMLSPCGYFKNDLLFAVSSRCTKTFFELVPCPVAKCWT